MTTHPYYTAKAAAVLAEAGGPADIDPAPLAAWAEAAHAAGGDDSRGGVILDTTGRLLAQTRQCGRPGERVAYVTDALDPVAADVVNDVYDMAREGLRRLVGADVLHVRYSEVATGRDPR